MPNKEELKQRLSEAEEALHLLMTGKQSVSVSYNGRSVTYTQSGRADLEQYIKKLETRLSGRPKARPVHF